MLTEELSNILIEQRAIGSQYLKRYVIIDLYLPKNISNPAEMSLLLINDGQDLEEIKFSTLYNSLLESDQVQPLFCVGIHAGKHRKMEYGTADIPDFEGRGATANAYQQFILEELIPFIHMEYAIDTVWHHSDVFSIADVFSGSLWWRSTALDDNYNDDTDRIMHFKIRKGE